MSGPDYRNDSFPPPSLRNYSQPLSASNTTISTGPSRKEPALITSKWTTGWQTPTLMITCYVLALFIAIAHLLLFQHIHGRQADGPDAVAPQTYITTASNLLANAFGFALRGALAIAFVQYLWHLLRAQTMKVSTIELLFCIRSNPLLLLQWASIKATPSLCLLALLMWGTQIATSFPPGAITVTTAQAVSFGTVPVPTFNASFMGNGSGVDASNYAINTLGASPEQSGFASTGLIDNSYSDLTVRVAFQTLVSGESFPIISPCGGVNCSYVVEFEGPQFICENTTQTTQINGTNNFSIYSGTWIDSRDISTAPRLANGSVYKGNYSNAHYSATTLTALGANLQAVTNFKNGSSALIQADSIVCLPGRSKFVVNNTYTNNILSRTVDTTPVDRLTNLIPLTHNNVVSVPGLEDVTKVQSGDPWLTTPANWSDYSLAFYRDLNHMAIIDAMMFYMIGSYDATPSTVVAESAYNFDNNLIPNWTTSGLYWTNRFDSDGLSIINSTIVDRTRFNSAFGHFSRTDDGHPNFTVTQDLLNEHLFNMTTSIMMAYRFWNTTANATLLHQINVFDFSQPLNLLIPYFLSLVLALPFMILGTLALFKNGVAATDGGFMQIITTSTGSAILDRAAAGGCLGGNESAPQELKDLKIRFGEFIGRDEPGRIKRAGFGVDSEVVPLTKGENYGIARWI